MVPVGGSIVCSSDKQLIQALSTTYPGRASSAPVVDLFLTFLSLGKTGYSKLLMERKVGVDSFFTHSLTAFIATASSH
jgi:O-phospho-L-seryl-tRNASec:L-selenocysteinyl-tRNA synthase